MAKRPTVHLNQACSLDGRIAAPDGEAMPLSDDVDWMRVHRLRASLDAILVGVNTVIQDNPSLRVKQDLVAGPDPLRVVLDTHGRTPQNARVVDGSAETMIIHAPGIEADWPLCDQREVPLDGDRLDLAAALEVLADEGVRSVLVEGGATLGRAFIDAGLVDTWTLYQAPVVIGGDGPQIWSGPASGQGRRFHVETAQRQGKGVLWTMRP